jgi:hypothetical protein
LVEGLAKSLDALPDDSALALACECLASTFDDKLRNALFRYIKRFAAGQVATISGVLPTASPRVAIALVRLLADLKTPEALASLEKALRNPAVEVRVEALARSNEGPSERMREELARLFAEPNAEARAQALRVVGAAGLVAAGPIVALKLQEPTFHALPMAERKLWFECLAALNPRRADAIALEILVQKKLMPPKPVEETRVLAAEQLAKSRHRESLEALKKVAGDRWFTSQVVRDAAAKAATELEASMKAAAAKGAAKAPVKAPTKEAPKQAPKDATKEKP